MQAASCILARKHETMKKSTLLFLGFFLLANSYLFAQEVLPGITVKNMNGKIIVSWLNDYAKPVTNILIQRSFDSLKNFKTIGSVLNPLNKENGYPDVNPPYNKMYYRLSISFEGGTYVIGPSVRPVKEIQVAIPEEPYMTEPEPELQPEPGKQPTAPKDSVKKPATKQPEPNVRFPWQLNQSFDSSVIIPPKKDEITYPSNRVFTGRQNNVVIHLPEASVKKYMVKFFDEEERFLFELNKLHEEYLIIEKVNFKHAGWFNFEVYVNGKLIEKNKFYIGKDGKNNNK